MKEFRDHRPNGTLRIAMQTETPSKTDTSFKDDCDINTIVAKFKKTGQINHLSKKQGFYGDATQLPDLQTASQQIADAHEAFSALPANVRKKFQNDPAQMIEFLRDPQNEHEATKLGLLKPKPALKNDELNDEKSGDTKTPKKAPKAAAPADPASDT